VEFSSAQQSARNNCYKVEDANHIEVCKPPSKEHPSYRLLLQFINACQEVSFHCLVISKFHKCLIKCSILDILKNCDCENRLSPRPVLGFSPSFSNEILVFSLRVTNRLTL
jgi:hypothetical protein